MKPMRLLFALAVFLALGQTGWAKDVITLKNGNSFEGRILDESKDTIRIQVGPGEEISFRKEDVEKVIRGKPEPAPPQPVLPRPADAARGAAEKRGDPPGAAVDRAKADVEFYALIENARRANAERRFEAAMKDLDKARQLAAKRLPPERLKELDEESELVLETARIIVKIDIRKVYVPEEVTEETVSRKRREMRIEREHGISREAREAEEDLDDSMRRELAQQIRECLVRQLQKLGYVPVAPGQLNVRRSSVLSVSYEEGGVLGPVAMGPRDSVYGVGLEVKCDLRITAPNGAEVWEQSISFSTPSAPDGPPSAYQDNPPVAIGAGRAAFFERLRQLTFGTRGS